MHDRHWILCMFCMTNTNWIGMVVFFVDNLRSLLDINFPLTANEFHSMVRRAVHIQNPDTDNFPLNFTNYTTYELQKHRTRINCNTN